jgi:hypothetical protein
MGAAYCSQREPLSKTRDVLVGERLKAWEFEYLKILDGGMTRKMISAE